MDISKAEFSPVENNKNSEMSLPDIDEKLKKLKSFEKDLVNEEVDKARECLATVFAPELEWFNSRGIILTTHGSVLYKDPRNLDVDMDFVGENISYKDLKEKWKKAEDELKSSWPRKNCDVDFGIITVEGIESDFKQLEAQGQDLGDEADLTPDLNASSVLSSAVLFESQRPKLEAKQREVRSLLVNNPKLREGVLMTLTGVIKTREERRREITLKQP